MRTRTWLLPSVLHALLLTACPGDSDDPADGPDADLDTAADLDAAPDTASDARTDGAPDADLEAGHDAPADLDAVTDLAADITPDAADAADAGGDAPPDATDAANVTPDAADAGGDAPPDAPDDAAGDTPIGFEIRADRFVVQRSRAGNLVFFLAGRAHPAIDFTGIEASVLLASGSTVDGLSFALSEVYREGTSFELAGNAGNDVGVVSVSAAITAATLDSDTLTASPEGPAEVGERCIAVPGAATNTCVDGAYCAPPSDRRLLGTCVAVAAPSLEVEHLGFARDTTTCSVTTPELGRIRLSGESALGLSTAQVGEDTFDLEDIPPGPFSFVVGLCYGLAVVDEPLPAWVTDPFGNRSDTADAAFPGLAEGAECSRNLYGQCGPGLYCSPFAGTCVAPLDPNGASCDDPVVIDAPQTRIAESSSARGDSFIGLPCIGGLAEGFDTVYAIPLEPGETASVEVRATTAVPVYVSLSETCQRMPTDCAVAPAPDLPEDLTYTNDGAEPMTLYAFVTNFAPELDGAHQISVSVDSLTPACATDTFCGPPGRPNYLFVVDYSTSMNLPNGVGDLRTRWERVREVLDILLTSGSQPLELDAHVALMRFGHDPSAAPGTTIPGDTTGLVDGSRLDVPWFEVDDGGAATYDICTIGRVASALDAVGPPMGGDLTGIDTWTGGAMAHARALILEGLALDGGARRVNQVVIVTDGAWTSRDGATALAPPEDSPVSIAADLWDTYRIPTWVIVVGDDPAALAAGDAIADAGGTPRAAISADDFDQMTDYLVFACD